MAVLGNSSEFWLELGVEEEFVEGEGGVDELAKVGEAGVESVVSQQVADDLGVEVEGVGEEGGGGVGLTVEVEEMVADEGGVRGKAIALLQFVPCGGTEEVEGELDGGMFGADVVLQVGVEAFVAAIEFGGEGEGEDIEVDGGKLELVLQPS